MVDKFTLFYLTQSNRKIFCQIRPQNINTFDQQKKRGKKFKGHFIEICGSRNPIEIF